MKIVYIAYSFIPSRTANSLHVMKMCQAFANNGHQVFLIVPDKQDEYEADVLDIFKFYKVEPVFKVIRIPLIKIKGKIILFWLILIYQLVTIKPDLVYGRYIIGVFLAVKLRFNCILEVHNLIWQNAWIERACFVRLVKNNYFKRLTVISEILKKDYVGKGIVDESRILVAHDGADLAPQHIEPMDRLGRKNAMQVGYVGHLYPGKGMEVIQQIADKLPNIDFHIIGGYEKDVNYWKSRVLASNVYFYGFVSQKKLGRYLHQLEVCLLPNQRKLYVHKSKKKNIGEYTSPLKMFDYMSYKKTIVASDVPQAWIEALEYLSVNSDTRERLAEEALNNFTTHYTWKKRALKVLS